jgi:hypothetical protein
MHREVINTQVDGCGGPHVPRGCSITKVDKSGWGFIREPLSLWCHQRKKEKWHLFSHFWDTLLFLRNVSSAWGWRGQFWNIPVFFWPMVWLNTTIFDFLVWNKVIFRNRLAEWAVLVSSTLSNVI